MTIVRHYPLRDLLAMQNAVDRIFYNTIRTTKTTADAETQRLAVDVYETTTGYTVSADVPGVDPDAIQVKLEDNILTITTDVPQTTVHDENARALLLERANGRFTRRIRLGQPVDFDHVEAHYDRGVLHLTLPKSPEAQPKIITVKSVMTPEPSAN